MPLSLMKIYIIKKEEKLDFGFPGKPRQKVFKRMLVFYKNLKTISS
jgi:hypothetical protein